MLRFHLRVKYVVELVSKICVTVTEATQDHFFLIMHSSSVCTMNETPTKIGIPITFRELRQRSSWRIEDNILYTQSLHRFSDTTFAHLKEFRQIFPFGPCHRSNCLPFV